MFENLQKIRFDQVDGAGILYYPRFFDLCHRAFEDMFDLEGPVSYSDLVSKRRLGFPAVHLKSDFFAPLSYGEVARVHVLIQKIGNSSLVTRYEIIRDNDKKKCFESEITTVMMDLDKRSSEPIKDDIRNFLEKKKSEKRAE